MLHVAPASVDFHATMLPLYTMFAFFGSTLSSAKSEPRLCTRTSSPVLRQLPPASSERKMPLRAPASIVRYSRRGSLGATARPMRPRPSANVGRPFMIGFHVVPPSVDLNSPLPGPCQTPFSHGACRDSHAARYKVFGSLG